MTNKEIEKYVQDKIDELNEGKIALDYFILCLKGHFEDGDFDNYDY